MKNIVFRIGSGKVVHYGTEYVNGAIESACGNPYANERNKDKKQYSSLEEITCKACKAHKEWYVNLEKTKKELDEKRKTYELQDFDVAVVGEIYKYKANKHLSHNHSLFKVEVMEVYTRFYDGKPCERIKYRVLNDDLTPVIENNKEIVVDLNLEQFSNSFVLVVGNKYNA